MFRKLIIVDLLSNLIPSRLQLEFNPRDGIEILNDKFMTSFSKQTSNDKSSEVTISPENSKKVKRNYALIFFNSKLGLDLGFVSE